MVGNSRQNKQWSGETRPQGPKIETTNESSGVKSDAAENGRVREDTMHKEIQAETRRKQMGI